MCADDDPEGAFALCRTLRKGDARVDSILLLITGAQLHELEHRDDLFDEFCLTPFHPKELEARFRHLLFRAGRGESPELASYSDLVLNFETYQAAISGKPLDLTYMEYELLKFFLTHPGKVFTREQLLSRVWGYEYYGGARTVDVHVRRLRAKLGEEHANLIQTVRSVGYRFGQTALARGERRRSGRRRLSFGAIGVVGQSPAGQRRPDRAHDEQADRPDDGHCQNQEHHADHTRNTNEHRNLIGGLDPPEGTKTTNQIGGLNPPEGTKTTNQIGGLAGRWAQASISTRAPPGSAATCTVERAGRWVPNASA